MQYTLIKFFAPSQNFEISIFLHPHSKITLFEVKFVEKLIMVWKSYFAFVLCAHARTYFANKTWNDIKKPGTHSFVFVDLQKSRSIVKQLVYIPNKPSKRPLNCENTTPAAFSKQISGMQKYRSIYWLRISFKFCTTKFPHEVRNKGNAYLYSRRMRIPTGKRWTQHTELHTRVHAHTPFSTGLN